MTHHDAHLARSVELAREALDAGDDPFGSVLVDADDNVVAEARNKESSLADPTAHPELELAQWASRNLSAVADVQSWRAVLGAEREDVADSRHLGVVHVAMP